MKAPSEFSRGNSKGKWVMELSKMTAVDRYQNTYTNIYMTLSPKDYCLIPGNFAIKFVETQNLL